MCPVESANEFLPQQPSPFNAFDLVALKHAHIIGGIHTADDIRRVSFEALREPASDFFTAGVAYLANYGHDGYLQEVGTAAWWAVNQTRVLLAMTDDKVGAAIMFGVPPIVAMEALEENDVPDVIMAGKKEGGEIIEMAYALIPPEFIVRAKNNPVGGLSAMVFLCSHFRDLVNGRLYVDKEKIILRAWATESHFIQGVLKQYPDVELDEKLHYVLDHYPNGLDDLPKGARYKGISGTEFMSASDN